MDCHATTRSIPGSSRRCCRTSPSTSATPRAGPSFGWVARRAVDRAREQVAGLMGANPARGRLHERRDRVEQPRDKGVAARGRGDHIVTVRHRASARAGSVRGISSARMRRHAAGDRSARSCRRLVRRVTDRTVLISVMTANNEIGVIQPMTRSVPRRSGAGRAHRRRRRPGKIPFDVTRWSRSRLLTATRCTVRKAWARSSCGATIRAWSLRRDGWGRSGARSSVGNPERPGNCRFREGGRTLSGMPFHRGGGVSGALARSPARRPSRSHSRPGGQRDARLAPAAQSERQLPHRERIARHGDRRRR